MSNLSVKRGEIVNVNDGYARNFILPKKLGVEATGKNLNDLKLQKNNEKKVAQENLDAAKALAGEAAEGEVVLAIKVGEGEEPSFCIQQGNRCGGEGADGT